MEPQSKNSKNLTIESLPPEDLVDLQGVEFTYPEDLKEELATHKQEMETKLRAFLINYISLDPFDFIIFQQRVLYRKNAREIGRFPLLPGRMAVKARCKDLADRFPIFKGALLAGFDKPDDEEDDDLCQKRKKKNQ